jgi:lipopolysaccharide export system protein LptA
MLFLATVGLLGYFAFISTSINNVPIERSDRQALPLDEESARGSKVRFKSYDKEGNEIITGSSNKVTRNNDSRITLEDGLRMRINRSGQVYSVIADSYGIGDDGHQVMTADPGNKIVLTVDDTRIETAGPLFYYEEQDLFTTDAVAVFSLGESMGKAHGLRYKPETFLELLGDNELLTRDAESELLLLADYMRFDDIDKKGLIRNGTITSRARPDQPETKLEAEEIQLLYRGGTKGESLALIQATLDGSPAKLAWDQGDLVSSSFQVCYDESGTWIEELITDVDAHFSMRTNDGYLLYGTGGQLSLWMERGTPVELSGNAPIDIDGYREGAETLRLAGQSGLETRFREGRAYSTRLFGQPTFSYGTQEGVAGGFRISHNERNILFSGGSELWDSAEDIRVKADQILLSDWDQEEKEVNAFQFVEITFQENSPDIVQSFGDELKLLLPSRFIQLVGEPAKVNRRNLTIDAHDIQIDRLDDELFDLTATASNTEVYLLMATENGSAQIQAKSLKYTGEKDVLVFEDVSRAVLPGQGELSCEIMTVTLRDKGDKKVIDTISAENEVLFTGTIDDEGTARTLHCRADKMLYRQAEEVIYFYGESREVVFTHPSGEFRGKELTYQLKDGTIRGGSDKHGTTRTTINIDDDQLPL